MKELGPVFIWGIREKIGEMITKKRKLIGIISMIMISSMMIGECKLIVSADDESNIIDEEHENLIQDNVIIPVLFEPPVRTLRATVPEKRSHIFR